jgi:hypothetical protein
MYINYDINAQLTYLVFTTHNLFFGSHLLTLERKADIYYKVFLGNNLNDAGLMGGGGGRGADKRTA